MAPIAHEQSSSTYGRSIMSTAVICALFVCTQSTYSLNNIIVFVSKPLTFLNLEPALVRKAQKLSSTFLCVDTLTSSVRTICEDLMNFGISADSDNSIHNCKKWVACIGPFSMQKKDYFVLCRKVVSFSTLSNFKMFSFISLTSSKFCTVWVWGIPWCCR